MEGDCKSTDAIRSAKLCTLVPSIGAVGGIEYVTATESMAPSSSTVVASASAWDCEAFSARGVSERVEGLMKARSEYARAVEYEIEASKGHWSEVASDEDDEKGESDEEVWARLQKTWGWFFRDSGDEMEVGEKIAEGGQAEIFMLPRAWGDSVVKVMKEGYRLRDLEKQWPLGMLRNQDNGGYWTGSACVIYGATLLKNGRFAFWMRKYWGDLRKLIDMRMLLNHNQCPPFTNAEVGHIVGRICRGMQQLHAHNIVHRDLKASNVLIHFFDEENIDLEQLDILDVDVADFECSVGVVGTGYWRAPEILQAVQQCDIKPELFTEKSDVYAFGMTCYEVLTGCIPFEELGGRCYDIVIEGRRPLLLENIDLGWKKLLNRCWHENPLERPSLIEIRGCLNELYSSK